MKLAVFAVFDKKAGFYSKPVFLQSKGIAVRSFSDEANNKSSEIGKHPEDFALYHLADYDDQEGTFVPACGNMPDFVAQASEFLSK